MSWPDLASHFSDTVPVNDKALGDPLALSASVQKMAGREHNSILSFMLGLPFFELQVGLFQLNPVAVKRVINGALAQFVLDTPLGSDRLDGMIQVCDALLEGIEAFGGVA